MAFAVVIERIPYAAPLKDLEDNTRPDTCYYLVDIGAYESTHKQPYTPPVGIQDHIKKSGNSPLTLYPIPFRDYLKIDIKNSNPTL